jgi:hypothetical protein
MQERKKSGTIEVAKGGEIKNTSTPLVIEP